MAKPSSCYPWSISERLQKTEEASPSLKPLSSLRTGVCREITFICRNFTCAVEKFHSNGRIPKCTGRFAHGIHLVVSNRICTRSYEIQTRNYFLIFWIFQPTGAHFSKKIFRIKTSQLHLDDRRWKPSNCAYSPMQHVHVQCHFHLFSWHHFSLMHLRWPFRTMLGIV